jgi:O-Antigen ligase
MNRLFAFAWLVIIGSNGAEHYSQEFPYQGAVILAGAAYLVFVFRRELLGLVFFKDYLLVLSMFVLPLLLMLLSDRSFERGAYTSQICYALVFVVASVLALRADLEQTLVIAAFAIVAVGAALNLYELFLQNNVWSGAPGRSAGFYGNPNQSSEALLGYGLVFLTARIGKLRFVDLILMALVVVGVFATFSRAGILAILVLLAAAVVIRVPRQYMTRTVAGAVAISLLVFMFASYVVNNIDLSKDATERIFSLIEAGGVGDYEKDRGVAASNALDLIDESAVFGAGVNTIYEMEEGPHNMFLAMMVDYGVGGLIVYLVVIIRLVITVRRAGRELSGIIWVYVGWLIIFSFASHNLLGQTATIPLMGFALARAYQIQASAESSELIDDFAR